MYYLTCRCKSSPLIGGGGGGGGKPIDKFTVVISFSVAVAA